ncbi:MAG: hypothetical protein V3W06_10185, partial [Acidimicrobiia bacterium]
MLLIGEFEDGLFADTDNDGVVQVFGSQDQENKFGSFGYTYNDVPSNNPSARRHLSEFWNGNGFLKAFRLKARGLVVARVDTSVGEVAFEPRICISGNSGPFALAVADVLTLTTDSGGPASSDALAAVVATAAGAASVFATITSGDTFGIRTDGGPQINVIFGAADISQAAVRTQINNTLGRTAAVDNVAEIDLLGIQAGTGGSVELIEVTAGVLAKIGHSVGVTAGTGNVADIAGVTVAEIVTIVNASAALTAIDVEADTGPNGELRLCSTVVAVTTTIEVTTTAMATACGISPLDTTLTLGDDLLGGTIAAGTRVRNVGGDEWVVMQTQDVPADELGPYVVKVRPALDDGTALGALAGTVTTLVDSSSIGALTVTNPNALTVALTEPQLDAAYVAAMAATLDEEGPAFAANLMVSARRSDTVVREGKANALKATECGLSARKFVTGDPLGTTTSQILTNVALFRSDRVFYTGKGLFVNVPNIAVRGLDGGLGFTADGTITVRPDGPLTTICAIRPPEENPGQNVDGLIDLFFKVNTFGETLTIENYKAFKAAGVAVPKLDRTTGMGFQSGVTSSLVSGRTTMARRKMADFIQDSAVPLFAPYVKLLSRESIRNKVFGLWGQFLKGLKSENSPDASRIIGFVLDDSENAGNTETSLKLGIYIIQTVVQTIPSMDDIVIQTEIGENAIISTQ